jgi:hypothetical protein
MRWLCDEKGMKDDYISLLYELCTEYVELYEHVIQEQNDDKLNGIYDEVSNLLLTLNS